MRSTQCTLCNALYAMQSMQCTLYTLGYALYDMQCTLCYALDAMYSMHSMLRTPFATFSHMRVLFDAGALPRKLTQAPLMSFPPVFIASSLSLSLCLLCSMTSALYHAICSLPSLFLLLPSPCIIVSLGHRWSWFRVRVPNQLRFRMVSAPACIRERNDNVKARLSATVGIWFIQEEFRRCPLYFAMFCNTGL